MGSAGELGLFFPGFGLTSGKDWRCAVRFWPMSLVGDRPLQTRSHNSGWMNTVVRVGIGCVAFVATTVVAEAQTYYYYPTSGTSAPTVTSDSTSTPTYYYRRGWFGRRVWTHYSPQSYQTTYTPQYYQQANAPQTAQQTEVSQTPAATQVIPVSYSANAITGTAALASETTAASAGTETAAAIAATESTAAPAATGDPYGFIGWLNSTRAAYGLPAVGYDPNLSSGRPRTTITRLPGEWVIL